MTGQLSPRERDVVHGLWDGLLHKEIAVRLQISESRVDALAIQARRKLHARTTIDLMRKAVRQGVLTA